MRLITAPCDGDVLGCTSTPYPSVLEVFSTERVVSHPFATHYGYVLKGSARLKGEGFSAELQEGGYFSAPGDVQLEPAGLTVVVSRIGFHGMLHLGKIEETGRLSYIDGCSDTLLIPPPRAGDACFNFLHFPRGVLQTQHTHPTIRAGIVARGHGHAYQLPHGGNSGWEHELTPGCVFVLEPQEIHSFRTDKTDEIMDVIAFHPDSDWGPTDALHPMRNRTYIGNGLSGA